MTVLATDAPNEVPACPAPLRPVRAAIVGLGRAGIAHAAVLSTIPGCEVVGLADPRQQARRAARGLGFSAPAFADVRKLLARAAPEAVIVCAADAARAGVARAALDAGAAVLVHRPLARTLAEARDLARLAAERERPLACGHPLAHHAVFARARALLAAGALGAVGQVRSSIYLSRVFGPAQQRALAPPGAAGGVVAQAACDLLFLLVWCLGTPSTVRATWSRLHGAHEDELHAMLALPGGAEVGFDSSWSVPGYPRPATVIEAEGENGKLLASDDALEIDLRGPRAGCAAGHTRLGQEALPQPGRFDLEGDGLYLQDAAFLQWATGGPAPPGEAATAVEVVRVVEALYASARDGGRATAVPE